jgi:hypothetical protein
MAHEPTRALQEADSVRRDDRRSRRYRDHDHLRLRLLGRRLRTSTVRLMPSATTSDQESCDCENRECFHVSIDEALELAAREEMQTLLISWNEVRFLLGIVFVRVRHGHVRRG